jgi:molybdopterin synthase catalytic subunit
MLVQIEITTQPIDTRRELPEEFSRNAGALAEFSGIVRSEEDGRDIAALEYEAYLPMAGRVMRDIIAEIGRQHPCLFVRVTHRVGIVPVGEAAIHIVTAARHRAEAFVMLTEFMNRLKQDVPIWKHRSLNGDELEALKKS